MFLCRLLPFCLLGLVASAVRADEDLPPDVKKLIEENEKATDAVLKKAEDLLRKAQEEHAKAQEDVRQRKAKLIEQLETLAVRLEKEGKTKQAKIIAEEAEELKTGRIAGAQPDPGSLTNLRGQNGKVFVFDVTGRAGAGGIWGTDVYTDDSSLAAAAVHTGVLKDGERGAVKVTILPGLPAYQGTTRQGVTTRDWPEYGGSYKVEPYRKRLNKGGGGLQGGGGGAGAMADPGTLDGFRARVGQSLIFEVTGNANGVIWGTDIYTDDSALATAAVHAGVLKVGEKGLVKVTILAGEQAYQDSARNGVTSSSYAAWGGSYKVERAPRK